MPPFNFLQQTAFYRGKVRDVYTINEDILVMIASDRISAFDVILPRPIPYKGQVLNQISAYMLQATRDICKNWLIATPTPDSSLGRKCVPFKIEIVVRSRLAGHAWRTYLSGKRTLCGVSLPDNMVENQAFETPIITPSTKAAEGHDMDISGEEIVNQQLATAEQWDQLKQIALRLFKRGQELAENRGLILVDTKYEFGTIGDEIFLMDEIHTPDSSRYFYAEGFEERQKKGEKQQQLSKEFVREWLIENNFMGKEGQQVPEMSETWVKTISEKYIELYELVVGKPFVPIRLSSEEQYQKISDSIEALKLNT